LPEEVDANGAVEIAAEVAVLANVMFVAVNVMPWAAALLTVS
jgi:hypothetical protein